MRGLITNVNPLYYWSKGNVGKRNLPSKICPTNFAGAIERVKNQNIFTADLPMLLRTFSQFYQQISFQ